MFTQPPALLFFVAKKLANGEPLERFLEFALVRRDHAGKRRRELRTERHLAFALIREVEKLIDNFWAALFLVKLCGFERRPFPFDEPVATTHFPPAREAEFTILRRNSRDSGIKGPET